MSSHDKHGEALRHMAEEQLKSAEFRERLLTVLSVPQASELCDLALEGIAARFAPSATELSEGYPGIAHDLETMRAALRQIAEYVAINEMTVAPSLPAAPRHMQAIARAALLKSAAPSHEGTINAEAQQDSADSSTEHKHAAAASAPSATVAQIPADRLPRLIELVREACRHANRTCNERDYEAFHAIRGELEKEAARLAPSDDGAKP